MGVTSKDVALLTALRDRGVSFERTLTIGRQSLAADIAGLVAGAAEGGRPMPEADAARLIEGGGGYAEPLLWHLGALEAHSIDASSYEGATFAHDLNLPLPEDRQQRYSLVFDGGSLEHIFNVPQALANYMSAVERGGHLIVATTCTNYVGHGFYQFSPEFFFRALTPENGFQVRLLLVRALHPWARWRRVSDPAEVGGRVELTNAWPTLIYVVARRTSAAPIFSAWPQQSDYVPAWDTGPRRARRRRSVDRLPAPARHVAGVVSKLIGTTSGPGHFAAVEMADLRLDP